MGREIPFSMVAFNVGLIIFGIRSNSFGLIGTGLIFLGRIGFTF
jgi:hypothetical protein